MKEIFAVISVLFMIVAFLVGWTAYSAEGLETIMQQQFYITGAIFWMLAGIYFILLSRVVK